MIFLSKSPFKQANDNHYDHFSIGPSRILDSPSINSYLVKSCSSNYIELENGPSSLLLKSPQ